MITCTPKNPTGYLIAGHCYKEQGNQEKAIEAFNMGLKRVSITHKQYETLDQGKQEAESRKHQRTDLLGRLPLDIAHYIIDEYFDQKSIIPYSRVSLTWRNIIINYRKFWERMTVDWDTTTARTSKEKEISLPYMLLPSIRQYLQELQVLNISQVATLFKLFETNNFSKIRLLKII